jgi:hypothetical protein
MNAIKLLDVVALTEDLPAEGLQRGEAGTVVEKWADGIFEVEFSDNNGKAYAFAAIDGDKLIRLYFRKADKAPVLHLNEIKTYKVGDRREKITPSTIFDSLLWTISALIFSSIGSLVMVRFNKPETFSWLLVGIVASFIVVLITFTLILLRVKKRRLKTTAVKEHLLAGFIGALDSSSLNPTNFEGENYG